jgi:hypothetical protein
MADVTITVDGKTLTVPAGTLLIDVCRKAGIEIPAFCSYPGLSPQAACRMCLVRQEKVGKLQTACTTAVAGAHSDQHSCGSPRAPGRCRHHHQHPLPGASGTVRLYAHTKGPRAGRGVARVCALGQTAHTGHGHVEAGVSGSRGYRAGDELTPQARKARKMSGAPFSIAGIAWFERRFFFESATTCGRRLLARLPQEARFANFVARRPVVGRARASILGARELRMKPT